MNNKEKNFVSAVIYVHNAEEQIEAFLKMIIDVLDTNFEHSEIICVNDFSTDRSIEKIREMSLLNQNMCISVVHMSYFHGLELAMNAGVDLAIGDFVFEFDSTILDYDSTVIMEIYKHSLKGFDIVSASPDKKEKWSSRLFYSIFNIFSDSFYAHGVQRKHISRTDGHSTRKYSLRKNTARMNTERFRILSRRVINRIGSMHKAVPYRKAVYFHCGLQTDNIKYKAESNITNHTDKKEKDYRWMLAVDTLILFTQLGYKISLAMTLTMMLISVFMIIYSVVVYITADPITGWTTTILFLSVAFLGLFGILTIILKYLQILVDMVFKRKHYCFDSIEKLTI